MKRRVYAVTVLMILGAVVNVIVAWGFAIAAEQEFTPQIPPEPAAWRAPVPSNWPDKPIKEEKWVSNAMGIVFYWQLGVSDSLGDEVAYVLQDYRFGVPTGSLSWSRLRARARADTSWTESWRHALAVPGVLAEKDTYRLPMRPIWLLFIANSSFYGALLWLLLRGPVALRRYLRVKRHLCATCGYRTGDSPVCTECGNTLPEHSVA